MKRIFYLLGLLLAMVMCGMTFASCGDENEGGEDGGDVLSMVKGMWKNDESTADYTYWEVTGKYLNMYYVRYGEKRLGERYTYAFDKKTNTLVCTYIDLDTGQPNEEKFYVEVITVSQTKLYVRYYDEGNERYAEPATFTKMN